MSEVETKHTGPGFWERLQPRERVLIMALVGVFFLMSTLLSIYLRHKKLTEIEDEITDLRDGLDLVRTFGPAHREKLAAKVEHEDKVAVEPLLFASLIEEAQSIVDVQAANQSEKPPVEVAPGLQMRTYEFDLRSVTLTQLTQFLSTIESKEGHVVITQGLTIRSPSTSEDRLNVDVVLATYERVDPKDEDSEEKSP